MLHIHVSKLWYGSHCLGFLWRTQTSLHVIAHRGCANTILESVLKVNSEWKKKNPCCSRELKQYTKLNTLPTKLHLCSIQVSLHTERPCLRKGDRPDQLSYIPAPYWFYYRLKDFTQGKCQTWSSTRWAASLPCTNFITYKECVPETRARPSAQQDEQHPCPIQVLLYTDR